MSVYDRGGWDPGTVQTLHQEGIQNVGIEPRGKAPWAVADEDQKEVRRQRAMTEGSIGTLKSRKYQFTHTQHRSNQTVEAAGQWALVCLNLNTLLRDIGRQATKAEPAAA